MCSASLVWRPLPTANVSAAALFRVVEAYRPTLLIDEADTFLGEDNEDCAASSIPAIGAAARSCARSVGDDLSLARSQPIRRVAIGTHRPPARHLGRPLVSIALDLKRKLASEVRPIRSVSTASAILTSLARKTGPLGRRTMPSRITAVDPDMPAGLYNREADNWRPLLAIATRRRWRLAGPWPQGRARRAAADVEEVSRLELLLGDIRNVFARNSPATRTRISVRPPDREAVRDRPSPVGRIWQERQTADAEQARPPAQAARHRAAEGSASAPKPPTAISGTSSSEAWERFLSLEGEFKPEHRNKCDEMGTSDVFQSGTAETVFRFENRRSPITTGFFRCCQLERGD